MQIKSLRIKSYRSWRIADTASEQAIARMKQLELYATLKSEGLRAGLCLQATGLVKSNVLPLVKPLSPTGVGWGLESQSRRPKHTRKPQWTKQQEQAVLHLRRRYPLWGKRKLWKILVRDQQMMLSESTVGWIKPASFYHGQLKPRRRRQFKHHAKR